MILIWRGLWNIQDYTLLPKDPVKSANISCLAGTLVTIVLYLLQDSVAEITLALRPCARFGVELVWQQLAVASSVTLWRGQWVWFALIFEELASMWFVTLAAGWILTILNMGGLSTQLGAVPDPPLDIRTDVIRFPIDYVAQIYKTHVQYTALIKQQQQQQQPGQRLSTSPLSKPLLKTNRGTAKALYPLLDEIQLPLPDSLPS